jgi:enoyl-CoA hydratase
VSDADVLFERRGRLGLVTLNRPRALNTLTLAMVRAIDATLRAWADDAGIAAVAIRGAGERAFCAGGDIRALYESGIAGRYDEALQFWREEYPLNILIREYPKPFVALIRGIDMGGGVGVSVHGSHRAAVGDIAFAMPEVGIGFFPDVGATYVLPRLPAGVGLWLALSGQKLGTADACALGLATHAIVPAAEAAVLDALAAGTPPDAALAANAVDPGEAPVTALLPAIARLFAGDSVAAVFADLEREASAGAAAAFAADAATAIRRKSPTSLAIAFEQMRRGGSLDFRAAMRTEFRIASRIVRGHDLYEGIRAVVIDKDNAPRWRPATLAEVADSDIAAYFAPLARELV